MVQIYNRILFSDQKKEIKPFAATWMDLEMIMLSEVRKRKTNATGYHLYVRSRIMMQMNLFTT